MNQFSYEHGRRLFTPYSQQIWSQSVQGYSGTHDIGDSGIFNLHLPSQWPLKVISWSPFAAGVPIIKPYSSQRKENGKEEGRNKGHNFAFKTIPCK